MTAPTVLVHRDATLLARAVAARLVTRLVDVQSARRTASVVLTGGGIGVETLASLRDNPARDAVDWRELDVWWGDERFLPAGHPERNETQARAALLDAVPVDPARVRPMPASDGPDGSDAEAAAEWYAAWLRDATTPEDHGPVPAFDVLLLGVGPDGHTASLFPGQPAVYDDRPAVAVHGSPKPPPTRLTLTFDAINAAREVWVVVAGAEKAGAVAMALGGAGRVQVPAAGVRGRHRTLWLLDAAAASRLPSGLNRIASP
ncbi:MAG TPA: 6-phosphogluconolactonase [Mycobacteriales bacterium]|jgi:6-phosphogluconolactonase|nr:6-phosphogluconolactonase [Mycobacteriales bacterium]